MKKAKIIGIILICVILFVVFLFYILFKNPKDAKFSYIDEKVSIDTIQPDETVFVLRYQNDANDHRDFIVIVNRNKQVKYENLYFETSIEELSLSDYDNKLKNSKIPFEEEKLDVSDELLNETINIKNYNLGTKDSA